MSGLQPFHVAPKELDLDGSHQHGSRCGGARIGMTLGLVEVFAQTQDCASLTAWGGDFLQAVLGTAANMDDSENVTWYSACRG